ncbi:hypothetical protein GCWU000342_01367 [Shuttleworthella satelles DSM 14600]|uniref:Uncharacterized protein n=1 Tax=Shuttleworthella satelles DSM 14600 TaxID=626523 RepID=C4GBR4_9FIRM|nr:hypothetical protein GCWU000342_01367 [Shuttleworthia satelles DSM 14600]
MDGEPQMVLENMGDMILADKEIICDIVKRQVLLQVPVDKGDNILVEREDLLLLAGVFDLIDRAV